MSLRLTSLALPILLTGCSTLESAADHTRDFAQRHPVVTAFGAAVAIGGAIAALDHHHDPDVPRTATIQPVPCAANPAECR